MDINIKYCGGCNPKFDRTAFVKEIIEKLGERKDLKPGRDNEITLLVSGCERECLSALKGEHTIAINHLSNIKDIMKEIEERGHTMNYVTVKRVEECSAALITVSREKALNALNTEVLKDIDEAFTQAEKMNVSSIILTGAGERSFVAGADIAAMKDMTKEQAKEFSAYGSAVFRRIETFPIPVIGAVGGYALGGGLELALACDFRVASDNALFGLPELSLGIIPGFGGTQRLMRAVGTGTAKELMFTSERITADRALEIGLVNTVVPQKDLMEHVMLIAKKIAKNAPLAVVNAKKAMNEGMDVSIKEGLNIETTIFPDNFGTKEQLERMESFVKK